MDTQELSFDYDMATMALKGKRFREAEERFRNIAMTTNSADAWCGMGISKYGLIMEQVTIDEIFYCFDKAKLIDSTRIGELEKVVIQTSIDVVKNLYDVVIMTQQTINRAKSEKTRAAISTMAATFLTVNSINNGKTLATIASAGLTAMSYTNYVKAGGTIEDMNGIRVHVLSLIENIRVSLRQFIKLETILFDEFNLALDTTHTEVTVNAPKRDDIAKLEKKGKRCHIWSLVCYGITVLGGIQMIAGDTQGLAYGLFYGCIGYYLEYRSKKFYALAKEEQTRLLN